jgi:hypothetical protein
LHSETIAVGGVMYRFAGADFRMSYHDTDWILKLGPPLG